MQMCVIIWAHRSAVVTPWDGSEVSCPEPWPSLALQGIQMMMKMVRMMMMTTMMMMVVVTGLRLLGWQLGE